MSQTESAAPATSTPPTSDPRWNPSYPRRIHAHEGPKWAEVLKTWEAKLSGVGTRLGSLGSDPRRESLTFLYHQMSGARDQIADAVRRLPGETGELHEEDLHRVHEAVAAFERLLTKWESLAA